MAKQWICTVCGYIAEGEEAPEKCPQCGAPRSKFKEMNPDAVSYTHLTLPTIGG